MRKKVFIIIIFLIFSTLSFLSSLFAQNNTAYENRIDWWEEARLGMFIHWGVYALYGGKYRGYEQVDPGAEWIMNRCKIPVAEYREKAKEFNPVNYNPEKWVKMARNAGMKYIVITSKHHDGFALFDSKVSDWDVTDATPYGKDLLKPLAEACQKHGLKLGFYYSQNQDWVHPGGAAYRRLTSSGWPNPDSTRIDQYTAEQNGHWDSIQGSKSFEYYVDHVAVPQVREILSNYGEISVLWWDTPNGMTDDAANKLYNELKSYPAILSNDRLKRPDFPGDFKTPEQRIPDPEKLSSQKWETCMTMNSSWGYREDNQWKSPETLIRSLVDIASMGGNLLLNVGPKPDGTFPEESIHRLEEIGEWMRVNGEAIYGTKASPMGQLTWGRCTEKELQKKTRLYFFIYDWPEDSRLRIPELMNQIVSVRLLSTGEKLKTSVINNELIINLSDVTPDKYVNVIRLDIKGKIEN